jgi:hypothetical protein
MPRGVARVNIKWGGGGVQHLIPAVQAEDTLITEGTCGWRGFHSSIWSVMGSTVGGIHISKHKHSTLSIILYV